MSGRDCFKRQLIAHQPFTTQSSKWANYEEATIGNLRILPNRNFIEPLRIDCGKMSEMFFGEPPIFENIMSEIERIENFINN